MVYRGEFGGLLWYIFPAECLVGVFPVELFFPAKKPQDERREVVEERDEKKNRWARVHTPAVNG